MTSIISNSKNLCSMGNLFKALSLSCLVLVLAHAALWTIDHKSFPGCTIITHEPGNVLVIELDEELATGTDYSCELAGKLVYSICLQGYKVRVTNWTISDVITLQRAYILARGY